MWKDLKEFTLPLFSYVCMVMGASALSLLIYFLVHNPIYMVVIPMCALALAIYYVGKMIWFDLEQYKVTITAWWRKEMYSKELFYEFTIRSGFLIVFIAIFIKLATFVF